MQKSVKHLATLSLATALALGSVVGCDNNTGRADKEVAKQVAEAETKHDPTGKTSLPILEKAAGETNASSAVKANAKAALAGGELEAANTIVDQITHNRLEMARLVWEISELAKQVRVSNGLVATYKKHDPAEARQAIEQKIAEAQGGEGKDAWITSDKASIPTLSAATQTISTKEGEIAKKNEEIKTLSAQRVKALDESEKSMRASEASKGQASVDQYKHASDLRKQASDLVVQIEAAQAAIVPSQHDLDVAQGQKKVLDEAIAAMQDQIKQIDEGWKAIGTQIDSQKALAKTLSSAEGETAAATTEPAAPSPEGNSIASKSAKLAELSKRTDELFALAEQNLNSALKHFNEAKSDAETLAKELRARADALAGAPELLKSVKNVQDTYNPATFGLEEALTQSKLAALYTGRARGLLAKQELASEIEPTLKDAGAKLPPGLDDPELGKSVKDAQKLADDTFKAADEGLVNIVEAPNASQDRKTAAHVGRIFTLYGWAMLARDLGQSKMVDDRMAAAAAARDAAIANNAVLPVLPVELAIAAPPPAPAPSTTTVPSTAPAAQPSTAPAAPSAGGSDLFKASN